MFTEKGWSLDASVGYAKENNLFSSDEMVCTKNSLQLRGFRITDNQKHRFTGKSLSETPNLRTHEKTGKYWVKALKSVLKQ